MTQTSKQIEPLASPAAGLANELIEQAAACAYAAIREMGITCGEVDNPTWQVATWDKKSDYRNAARMALEQDVAAQDVHNAWLIRKTGEGWNYGPEIDHAMRLHPLLKPWEELSEVQRFQYTLFLGVVLAFMGRKTKLR